MDEAASTAVIALMLAFSGLSLAALFYLFQKHIGGQPLLEYEPRRRVPWGPGVALLAMGLPLLSIFAFYASLFRADEEVSATEYSSAELLTMGWSDTAFKLLFVVGMTAVLVAMFRATRQDLGFPERWKQFTRDVIIGAFAMVAAFLPVYVVQLTLLTSLDSKTPHPLVEQLQEDPSPSMLLLGFVMAVIVAPLFEEFTFRGLLQGWLERHEDEVLRYAGTQPYPQALEQMQDNEALTADDSLLAQEASSLPSAEVLETPPPPRPTHGWIPNLPHGWTPILISGTAFGLAHLGHGVAPIPLVLFGIVLGYLYQRTHRLVPCIAAHMLFNGYSMVLLWLQLNGTAVP